MKDKKNDKFDSEQERIQREARMIEVFGLILTAAGLFLAYRRYKINLPK
jgi:hypothetical protein